MVNDFEQLESTGCNLCSRNASRCKLQAGIVFFESVQKLQEVFDSFYN